MIKNTTTNPINLGILLGGAIGAVVGIILATNLVPFLINR